MQNVSFKFKEFSISQDICPMKISTDSVLIGAWASVGSTASILDIGTGSGIIALMLAQRSNGIIDAIDMDEHACSQAKDNFSKSKWKNRVNIFQSSLQNFFPDKKYDVIVSNPPYFPLPNSHKEKERTHGKYTHALSFVELAEGVIRLLSAKGSFYVIFPVHEGAFFTNEAEKRKLFLTDYVWVKTTNRKKFPKRILMKFELDEKPINDNKLFVIQNDTGYTNEYKELTKDYYLKF